MADIAAKVKEWEAARDRLAKSIANGQQQVAAWQQEFLRLEGAIAGARQLMEPEKPNAPE